MSESEHKLIEILRILENQNKPVGSKFIANKLKDKGFNLGERAVRYYMQILDNKGFTERIGYSGRKITELGLNELEKGLIYNQVDFIQSKFKEMIYLTDFDINSLKGNVVINTSKIYDKKAIDIIKKVFNYKFCISPYISIKEKENYYEIKTICGTTIDGILLKNGIVSFPKYGGLLEIKDFTPIKFKNVISYKNTSIMPLDAFIGENTTSVINVIKNGNGLIPANLRLIPANKRNKAIEILKKLQNIGFLEIAISKENENMFGIPINKGMIGIVIIGGMTPLCAAQEMGFNIDIKIGEEITNFKNLKPMTNNYQKILKNPNYQTTEKLNFILNKIWNLIENVSLNIEKEKGQIISNITYLEKENINQAIEIIANTYKNNPNFINPYYKIIEKNNKIAIETISNLTIDGVLINNGIMCNPYYAGVLEIEEDKKFVDLISYIGTSIDPNKIFISKSKTDIINQKKILASLKEIPIIAREDSINILNKLKELEINILKIAKPREIIYNAKVNNYNFGVVTSSGLNQISVLNENNIKIIDSYLTTTNFENMEKF